jgi:excisionase family DNA binding protein
MREPRKGREESGDRSAPHQLALEDWAEDLSASRRLVKRVEASNGTASSRPVVSSRSQAPPVEANAEDALASMSAALLTTHEAATLLHVHPRTVQRLVERGELEAVHLGAAVRFVPGDVADLTARLKRRDAGPPSPALDDVQRSRAVRLSFADRLRSKQA